MKHLIRLFSMLAIALFVSGFTPHKVAAWPGSKFVNVQVNANAEGLQYWWTVKCQSAQLWDGTRYHDGVISDRRTNGCKVEFRDVPVNTTFGFRIDGVIDQGGSTIPIGGSWAKPEGVKAPTVGITVNLGSVVLRKK